MCTSSGEEIGKNFNESKKKLDVFFKNNVKVSLVKTWAMTQISKKTFRKKFIQVKRLIPCFDLIFLFTKSFYKKFIFSI